MFLRNLFSSLNHFIYRYLRKAEAAEERSKKFNQGGGGEKLKAKAKALEDARQKNNSMPGNNKNLDWRY